MMSPGIGHCLSKDMSVMCPHLEDVSPTVTELTGAVDHGPTSCLIWDVSGRAQGEPSCHNPGMPNSLENIFHGCRIASMLVASSTRSWFLLASTCFPVLDFELYIIFWSQIKHKSPSDTMAEVRVYHSPCNNINWI